MAWARPSWADWAIRWHSALAIRASVATTTSVVCSNGVGAGNDGPPAGAVEPARTVPSGPITSPAGLQATRAPTVASPTVTAAVPSPPATAYSRPRHFPTVAPRPAPIRPEVTGAPRPASTAAAQPPSAPSGPAPAPAAASAPRPPRGPRPPPAGIARRRPALFRPRRPVHRQVEEGGGHHDRNGTGRGGEPLAPLGQEPHDAVGRRQPEGRPAGQ